MKKALFCSLLLAGATATFAQQSNTSLSTDGLFGTDVDDYMDVNSWANVQPKKAFAFVGVENDAYSLGFAHQFSKFYWGTYFGGDLGDYSSTKTKTSGGGNTINIENTVAAPTDAAAFTFDNLFGIGALGIKAGFKYYDSNSTVVDNGNG